MVGNAYAVKLVRAWLASPPAERHRKRILLITGPTGSGKTTLARALAGELQCAFHVVDPTTIVDYSIDPPRLTDRFDTYVDRVARLPQNAGQVLLVDDMDGILEEFTAPTIGNIQRWSHIPPTAALLVVTAATLQHRQLRELRTHAAVLHIGLVSPNADDMRAYLRTKMMLHRLSPAAIQQASGNLHKLFMALGAHSGLGQRLVLADDLFESVRRIVTPVATEQLETPWEPDSISLMAAYVGEATPRLLQSWRDRLRALRPEDTGRLNQLVLGPTVRLADWLSELNMHDTFTARLEPLTPDITSTLLHASARHTYYAPGTELRGLADTAVPADMPFPYIVTAQRLQQSRRGTLMTLQAAVPLPVWSHVRTDSQDYELYMQTLLGRSQTLHDDTATAQLMTLTNGDLAVLDSALAKRRRRHTADVQT